MPPMSEEAWACIITCALLPGSLAVSQHDAAALLAQDKIDTPVVLRPRNEQARWLGKSAN